VHPTFSDPIVLVKQRENKFRLNSPGWGEFEINAHVTAKDGCRQQLKHWLQLPEPDSRSAQPTNGESRQSSSPPASRRGVGTSRARRAHQPRRRRADRQRSPSRRARRSSDQLNARQGQLRRGYLSDKSGPRAEREVIKAMQKDVYAIPLVVGSGAKLPTGLQTVQALHISDLSSVDAAGRPDRRQARIDRCLCPTHKAAMRN